MLRVLKLYYKVASSQLPALQIALRTKLVLESRQFSASSSTDCSAYESCTKKLPVLSFQLYRLLRVLKMYYKVASSQLPALQIAPRTKDVLQSRQFSASSSTDCSAYQSCTRKSPVLSFQLYRLLRVLKLYIFASSQQCLPRNLHMEVHKALRLPRNLHLEVRKVLHLPRNLHMELHKVLRLPRNLHLEVHNALCLPRNLRVDVHKVLRAPGHLHLEVHKVLRLPRNLHMDVHKVLHLPRNLDVEVHKVLCQPRNLHFKKQVKTLIFTKCCACYEICPHGGSQVLHLPRNLHMDVHKVLRLPRNLDMEVHKALCLPRNLHFKKQVKTLIPKEGRFRPCPNMIRE